MEYGARWIRNGEREGTEKEEKIDRKVKSKSNKPITKTKKARQTTTGLDAEAESATRSVTSNHSTWCMMPY